MQHRETGPLECIPKDYRRSQFGKVCLNDAREMSFRQGSKSKSASMILFRFCCFAVRFWLGEFESACSTLQVQGDGCSGSTKGAFTNIGPPWHCIYIALKLELRSFQPCFGNGISRGFSFVSVCGRACGGVFCYCHGTLGIYTWIDRKCQPHYFTWFYYYVHFHLQQLFFFDTCIVLSYRHCPIQNFELQQQWNWKECNPWRPDIPHLLAVWADQQCLVVGREGGHDRLHLDLRFKQRWGAPAV